MAAYVIAAIQNVNDPAGSQSINSWPALFSSSMGARLW